MKQFYLTLTLIVLTNLMYSQSFDMSLSLLGTNEDTGNYEVALLGTPNFTETNGNSADIGAVVSMSDNVYILPSGFVNECTTSGPPTFETTCEYPIEKEEWTADFLTEPTNNSPGRFVYQLLRTETGEATFFDAEDGVPIILAVFQIYNTESGLPSSGDIILIDNGDAILNGTPNASFLNIRYDTATSGVTTDLYNTHSSSANTINFGTLSTDTNTLDDISLSPNPTTGLVTIKGSAALDKIDIYNINGQLVKTFTDATALEFIDITELQAGVYFTRLYSQTKTQTLKTIKL